eukprot:TRINITY_DN738_c0_g1_i3.p2 TRINITY_DN738_c0_g1~~TRINITY_DN738_c0_g1_i3.p2  ORF type:complete len:109 (-),score=28.83 TRINITY_DN738_c0_g1_i3:68-394(-)
MAMSGLAFLSFYLLGKMGLYEDPSRIRPNRMWKYVLGFLPITAALWVAVSRTREYWHNFDDVMMGGLIGLFIAYFCYRLRFPALFRPAPPVPNQNNNPNDIEAFVDEE